MEGDGTSQNSPIKKEDGCQEEKLLKRVRKLDDDSDSERELNPSLNVSDQMRNRTSLQELATKKMRKWVDSDSDSESSSSRCRDADDTFDTSRHEIKRDGEQSPEQESGVETSDIRGGRSMESEAGDSVRGGGNEDREVESDSEGEGELEIDLDPHSHLDLNATAGQEAEKEDEAFGIQSPACDTVELLDHNEGDGGSLEIENQTGEHGSLATLAIQ